MVEAGPVIFIAPAGSNRSRQAPVGQDAIFVENVGEARRHNGFRRRKLRTFHRLVTIFLSGCHKPVEIELYKYNHGTTISLAEHN
jgi:hypothetical protein